MIKKNKLDQVGEDIIVKYKKDKDEKINCEYVVNEGDFEFKGDNNDNFYTIYNKYIVLEGGTGVDDRKLSVYDLDTRKEVYHKTFHVPLNISGSLLTFKFITSDIPNINNCPKYTELKNMGNAVFEKDVSFDLETLTEFIPEKRECVYGQ